MPSFRPEQYIAPSGPPLRVHPHWGERVTFESFHVELLPAAPRHFNVKLPQAFATISYSGDEGRSNLAGDRERKYERRPFEYLVAPPDLPLRGVSEAAPEMLAIVSDFHALRACLASALQVSPEDLGLRIFFGAPKPIITELALRVRKHILGGDVSKRYLESVCVVLLAEMLSAMQLPCRTKRQPIEPAIIQKIVEYIGANIGEDLSLGSLSEFAGSSPVQFNRAFKRILGTSPRQYILQERLRAARELLQTTDHSLSEIAFATGFSSQSHMTTTFKRVLATTPGALKKSELTTV